MSLTVAKGGVPEAAARIVGLTTGYGGYVLTSQVSTTDSSSPPFADITVRVPARQYDLAIQRFGALGRVQSVQTSATDVTGQYVDLNARLAEARRIDQRLLGFLGQARSVTEALAVQARIDSTELKVEELTGQLKALREQVTYGTLTVSVTEKPGHHAASPQGRLSRRPVDVVAPPRRRFRGDRRRPRRDHPVRRAPGGAGRRRLVRGQGRRPPAPEGPAPAAGRRRVRSSRAGNDPADTTGPGGRIEGSRR